MAKLKPDLIGVAEMKRYLETESDFDFELRVLHKLREQFNVDCEHGGHYEDPVTKKPREFDIRVRVKEEMLNLLMAIECKNLRPNFPLLVSCVPRTKEEAWHTMYYSATGSSMFADVRRVTGDDSRYPPREWVGKSTAQVGVATSGELTSNDAEVYEKWGQCLSSLHSLVQELPGFPSNGSWAIALPVLVVPNGSLWQARYNADGRPVADPEQVDYCPVYAGGYGIPFGSGSRFSVSHVDFMTFRGLMSFFAHNTRNADTMRSLILGRQRIG